MSSTRRQAEKSAQWAEKDLDQAREWIKNGPTPNHKREGRRMAREAKRRRAKARRRAWRAECEGIRTQRF